MSHKVWLFFLFFIVLAVFTWAQDQPQLYITGTVILADGGKLPSAVQVQLKCHGSTVQSMYTSPEGRFVFRMNQRRSTSRNSPGPGVKNRTGIGSSDVSIGGPAMPADIHPQAQVGRTAFHQTDLSTCLCVASLAGYQSEVIRLGVRGHFDNPDIGAIVLYPLDTVKGTTISVTTSKAPKKAMEAFEDAKKELSKKNGERSKAVAQLQKATEIYPGFAEAWQLLAEIYLLDGKESEARSALERALAADPQYVRPYAVLGEMALRSNNFEEAAELTGKAIDLNPYVISAQYCHAVAQFYLGQLEKAEKCIHRVQESNEAHLYPASHHLLGTIYAERGDYKAAAEEFLRFLETNPPENEAVNIRNALAEWEKAGLIEGSKTG